MLMNKKKTRFLVENWRKLINENSNNIDVTVSLDNLDYFIDNIENIDSNKLSMILNKAYKFLSPNNVNGFLHQHGKIKLKSKERFYLKKQPLLRGFKPTITVENKKINESLDATEKETLMIGGGIAFLLGAMLLSANSISYFRKGKDNIEDKVTQIGKEAVLSNPSLEVSVKDFQRTNDLMKRYVDNLYNSINAKLSNPNEDYGQVRTEIRIMLVKAKIFKEILNKGGIDKLDKDVENVVNKEFRNFNLETESKSKEMLKNYLKALLKINNITKKAALKVGK